MKTAISLPDDTFKAVDKRAHELGMSRSQFLATAARRYLDELDRLALTQQMDEALCRISADESASAAVTAGHDRLTRTEDW